MYHKQEKHHQILQQEHPRKRTWKQDTYLLWWWMKSGGRVVDAQVVAKPMGSGYRRRWWLNQGLGRWGCWGRMFAWVRGYRVWTSSPNAFRDYTDSLVGARVSWSRFIKLSWAGLQLVYWIAASLGLEIKEGWSGSSFMGPIRRPN